MDKCIAVEETEVISDEKGSSKSCKVTRIEHSFLGAMMAF